MKRIALIIGLLWFCGAGTLQAADNPPGPVESSPTGQASAWADPDRDQAGTPVTTRTFENAVGQPCREFTQTITIAGQKQPAYGTACRQPDGSWKIVADEPRPSAPVQAQAAPPPAPARPVYAYPAYAPYYPYAYGPYPYFPPFGFSLSFGYVFGGHSGHGHHH